MTDVRVTETFKDAAGVPSTGKVMFQPVVAVPDVTPPPGVVVTAQPVVATLDETGAIDQTLLSSWDDGWGGGEPVGYRIILAVAGLSAMYVALIPPEAGMTEIALHELVDISAVG